MPDWSSEEELQDIEETAEDWGTIFKVLVEMQKTKSSAEMLDMLTPPARDDLEKGISWAVASILAERIVKDPASISKLPNPQLLVHAMVVGALSGLIFAAANLPDDDDEEPPTTE